MTMKTICAVCALFLTLVAAAPRSTDDPAFLFEKAEHERMVSGDLDAAIRIYQQIVSKYASNRPLAAKALVEMGRAYEKLGRENAQESYERVLQDYPDQTAAVSAARARLAQLQRRPSENGGELVAQRI